MTPRPVEKVYEESLYLEVLKQKFPKYLKKNLDPKLAYDRTEIEKFVYAFLTEEDFLVKEGRKPTDEPRGVWWMIHGRKMTDSIIEAAEKSKIIEQMDTPGADPTFSPGSTYYRLYRPNLSKNIKKLWHWHNEPSI